jgi:hypothetical protein
MEDNNTFIDRMSASLRSVDWNSVADIKKKTEPVLRELAARKGLLRSMIESIYLSEDKINMCEKECGFINKFLLYCDPDDIFRIRLHILKSSKEKIPHSHGMSFSSIVLYGEYDHVLYSPGDYGEQLIDTNALAQILYTKERVGSHYAIHHSSIHEARVTSEYCITLMIRSYRQKPRAINVDLVRGKSWWQESAKSIQNTRHIKLGSSDLDDLIVTLESHGII